MLDAVEACCGFFVSHVRDKYSSIKNNNVSELFTLTYFRVALNSLEAETPSINYVLHDDLFQALKRFYVQGGVHRFVVVSPSRVVSVKD